MRNIFLVVAISLISYLDASQVVLITGASRGLGKLTAEVLANDGYTVYSGVRNLDLYTNEDDKIHPVELDVTKQDTIDQAVSDIIAREGRIDILINNAGIGIYGTVENVTIEEAQRIFDVNFFGPMRVSQAVLPHMRQQGSGRIIQISSRSAYRPFPAIGIYAASKSALEGLSETMAATLKPWNIHVSLIEPGPIATEMDFITPFGTKLPRGVDPFYPMFERIGVFKKMGGEPQNTLEVALVVKVAIEAEKPNFRYQTSEFLKNQATERLVDITGNTNLQEWIPILY